MTRCTLGVDMGTSGVKAALLDLDTFQLISVATRTYHHGAQQSSEMLWQATASTLREAVAGVNRAPSGHEYSGQMHGTVLYDAGAGFIDPIINWQDRRCEVPLARYSDRTTVEVMRDLIDRFRLRDLGIMSCPAVTSALPSSTSRKTMPALFQRVHHVVLPGDFIRGKLLGAWIVHRSHQRL